MKLLQLQGVIYTSQTFDLRLSDCLLQCTTRLYSTQWSKVE